MFICVLFSTMLEFNMTKIELLICVLMFDKRQSLFNMSHLFETAINMMHKII